MKPITPIRKALTTALFLCAALLAPASDLISAEAANVIRNLPTDGGKGKRLAMLESYLLNSRVTVGLDPSDKSDGKVTGIARGIRIWEDALPDSPFVLARPGEKPMITVKFVNSIDSGGDVQGQIEATRYLRWGSTVSYKITGTMLVRVNTGRRPLREDEITEVVAHELGHVLGLDDAEDCVGLMGPFVPGRARLRPSDDELQAVVQYRDQLREAIARVNNK